LKKQMGRETLYLGVAQGVFLIRNPIFSFAYLQNFGAIRYHTNAVSKYTAENKNLAGSIKNQTMKFQIVFAVVLCILLFTIAPLIANVLRDPTLPPYVRLTICFTPTFAIYSVTAVL